MTVEKLREEVESLREKILLQRKEMCDATLQDCGGGGGVFSCAKGRIRKGPKILNQSMSFILSPLSLTQFIACFLRIFEYRILIRRLKKYLGIRPSHKRYPPGLLLATNLKTITKIIVDSAIRRGSMKSYPACLSKVCFSYFPTFQAELFC